MKRITVAFALLALAGCAGRHAADSEAILAEAGFQRVGIENIEPKTVPHRQLFETSHGGSPAYKFADPDYCQCEYTGGTKELLKLEELRKARRDEHYLRLRQWSPYGSGHPDTWGPWDPMGLDLH